MRPPLPRRSVAVSALMLAVGLVVAGDGMALAGPEVVVVAGDIAAGLPVSQEAATAALVARTPGFVMTAGDNAYPNGSATDFAEHYDPTWGRFRKRTFPTPGNHDYWTPGAAGYFDYFGKRAGPRRPDGTGRGYYALKFGAWQVFALNSEACVQPQGCRKGSPQYQWLARKLASSNARCTLAVWHRPLFSSGERGSEPAVRPLQRLLYLSGAEIVVNGHDHTYERFAPARPDGSLDRTFGIRQFVVGTGGAWLRPRGPRPVDHSRVFQSKHFGVLKLTLRWDSYEWSFLPIERGAFADRGSGRCHGRP